MSLVHKIPPMVSALAFGYGVGMAAPEATISPVKAAVSVVQPSASAPALSPARFLEKAPPSPPPSRIASGIGTGDESRELGRLRDTAARSAESGGACDLERPSFSRAPRYESKIDRDSDDIDDLDAASTSTLSRLQLPDLKIPITRRTLKYVRFFTRTDRGRAMFESWLRRSGRYQEMIEGELRERGLPEDLIWVAMIESGFDARARSPAGAVGLWQFMPATGAVYGLLQSRFVDQRKNPALATRAAAHHLRDLYQRFGAWDLALASYNMGYEQLLDAIDRYGTADFNELSRQEAIPSETAAYVPKIAAAAIVANNLERFGFDKVEVSRPVDAAEIAVPPGMPLKALAKAAGVATSQLRALNPDILGDRLPPGRGDHLVMIPADTLSRARASLPALLENDPLVSPDAAALEPFDLLNDRALVKRRAQREDDSLLSLLPRPKRRGSLRDPGSEPRGGGIDDLARGDDVEDRLLDPERGRLFERDRDDEPRGVTPSPSRARKRRETLVYRVGPGDTLIGIARQFAMDVDDVSRQNRLEEGEKLKVGSFLKLRVRRDLLSEYGGAAPREDDKDKRGRDDKAQDDKDKGGGDGDGREAKEKPGPREASPPPARQEKRKKARHDPT
jgi:membrane-bound lytic murein transglycosylase D